MAVLKTEVFLVQGQLEKEGKERLDGVIEQIVVVAPDIEAMRTVMTTNAPEFRVTGWATLEDYEATAAKLRSALKREALDWRVLVAPGMAE